MICDFSWHCPHVGTFLNIQNPQPQQPSVEWFYSWDIPVWYIPGGGNPELAHLQPPSHILQTVTTFILKAPSSLQAPSPSPPTLEYSGLEYEKAQRAYIATRPWEVFSAACEVHHQEILAKETPKECQTCLNHEKKPPTKSAEVFYWDWSTDGAIELVCSWVSNREHEDVLSNHSNLQCKYDTVFNTWDVCDYFGPDDPDDDVDDYDGSSNVGIDSENLDVGPNMNPASVDAFINEWVKQSSTHRFLLAVAPSTGPGVDLMHEASQINVLRYISYFYGFVPPLPIPATDSIQLEKKTGKNVWSRLASRQSSIPATLVSLVLLWTSSSACKEMVHENFNGTYHQEIGSL